MKRVLILAVVAAGTALVARRLAEVAGPAMRQECSNMCDRFLEGMPQSFPPNRIMADLDNLKVQVARILELAEERESRK